MRNSRRLLATLTVYALVFLLLTPSTTAASGDTGLLVTASLRDTSRMIGAPPPVQQLVCSPRPKVIVATTKVAADRIQVTVTAGTTPALPTNGLSAIRFGEPRAPVN